jgi:hypothetical protein
MNERIKYLAEQAGHTPLEPRTFADDLNEIFLQKFAKLIVQECIAQCNDGDSRHFIATHFGVEE